MLENQDIIFEAEPHTYKYRGKAYRSVTDYITDILGDPFAGVSQDILKFAQRRGTMVHRAGELLMQGDLDWKSVDPRIEGYVRAIERFHKDRPGEIIYTEKKMVCPTIGTNGLAGTPDVLKWIGGRRCLIDYKTSQQMIPRMRLQTAGYKALHNALFPRAPIAERYGLRLQPDSYYKLIPHDDYDDDQAFDQLLKEAHIKESNARWWKKYA